jgi:serine/threonine protein kinase
MPSRADVNFLLTAVKAKFINADQAKQIYEAHQATEKRGEDPLIHQTASQLGLLDLAQTTKLQRMLAAVGDEGSVPGGSGEKKTSKKKVTQIGNFKLQAKVGEGAMGVVYKATHMTTGQEVAIKVLLRKFQEDPKYVGRFKREYTNAGRLNHVNIIEFHNAGQASKEQGGYFFFAMEYVDGETLQEILDRDGIMPESEAMRVGIEIGRALAHAHSLNIKHRDIKPDNIMISRNREIKLTDLGLAKEELDSSVTQAGMTIGTPHYMSPEQARGMELDDRSDMYSLGATIYHLLTGRPPFEGKSAAIVMMKHIEEQLPSPQEINPNISDNICAVIGKMMAKAPEDRYPNCDEVVADLERAVQGLPPIGEPVPSAKSSMRMPALKPQPQAAPQPLAAPQPQVAPQPLAAPPYAQEEAYDEPASSRPNGLVIAVMACVIVLLIALIVFLLVKSKGMG